MSLQWAVEHRGHRIAVEKTGTRGRITVDGLLALDRSAIFGCDLRAPVSIDGATWEIHFVLREGLPFGRHHVTMKVNGETVLSVDEYSINKRLSWVLTILFLLWIARSVYQITNFAIARSGS